MHCPECKGKLAFSVDYDRAMLLCCNNSECNRNVVYYPEHDLDLLHALESVVAHLPQGCLDDDNDATRIIWADRYERDGRGAVVVSQEEHEATKE